MTARYAIPSKIALEGADVLTEPKVCFSNWVRWCDRRKKLARRASCMGVYLWAYFPGGQPPSSRPFPNLPEEVIYIGETNDLGVRLLGGRHHRLKHYVDQFRDRNYERLYVSVCDVGPFHRSDPKCHALRAFTKYVEAHWSCPGLMEGERLSGHADTSSRFSYAMGDR